MRGGFDTYEITRRYIDIGKMYHFHLRDVSTHIPPTDSMCPCGTGKGRLKEIFQALNDSQTKPLMMLEYEHDFDNPMPYLIQSVNEINRLCEELIKANDEKARTGDTILLPAYKARNFSRNDNARERY